MGKAAALLWVAPVDTDPMADGTSLQVRPRASRRTECPGCHESFALPDFKGSVKARCPKCGEEFLCSPKVKLGLRGADDPLIGKEFCGCRVLELLGHGSLGSVYKAVQDGSSRRTVALKILPPFVGSRYPQFIARYLAQASRTADLNHPNIVPVHQVGEEKGFCYTIMKYMRGKSLADYLEGGKRMAPEDVVRAARAMAFGLREASNLGVLHRNLKPENVFIGTDGIFRVSDFGLGPGSSAELKGSPLGTVVLNPCYLSPEQVRGDSIDTRSDIYSLGAVLYRMVTGTLPFRDENTLAAVIRRLTVPVEPPQERKSSVPKELSDIICKMMATEPADRYRTWREVLTALDTAFADSVSEIATEISAATNSVHTPLPPDTKEDGTATERIETPLREILDELPLSDYGPLDDGLPEEPIPANDETPPPQFPLGHDDSIAPNTAPTVDIDFERQLTDQLEALKNTHFPDLRTGTPTRASLAGAGDPFALSPEDLPPPRQDSPPMIAGASGEDFGSLPQQKTTLGRLFPTETPATPTTPHQAVTPHAPERGPSAPDAGPLETPQPQTPQAPLTYVHAPHTQCQQTPGERTVTPGARKARMRYDRRRRAKEKQTALLLGAVIPTAILGLALAVLALAWGGKDEQPGAEAKPRPTNEKPSQPTGRPSSAGARETYEIFIAEAKRDPSNLEALRKSVARMTKEFPASAYTREAQRILKRQEGLQARLRSTRNELQQDIARLRHAHRWGDALAAASQFGQQSANPEAENWAAGMVQELESAAAAEFRQFSARARSAAGLGKTEEAKEIYRTIFVNFGIEDFADQARDRYAGLVNTVPEPEVEEESPAGDTARNQQSPGADAASSQIRLTPDFDLIDSMVRQWRFHDALERCAEYVNDPDYDGAEELRSRQSVLRQLPALKATLIERINQKGRGLDAADLLGAAASGTIFRASERSLIIQDGVKVSPYTWDLLAAPGIWKLVQELFPINEYESRIVAVLLIIELGEPELVEPEIRRLAAAGIDVRLCQERVKSRKAGTDRSF